MQKPVRLPGCPPAASGPNRQEGLPRAPAAARAPRKFANFTPYASGGTRTPTPPGRAAGRLGAEGRGGISAEIAVQPRWRNRPGPGADSTRPTALKGAFRRSGEAGRRGDGRASGRRGLRRATWKREDDDEEVSGLGNRAAPLRDLRTRLGGLSGPQRGRGSDWPGEGVPATRRSPRTPPAQTLGPRRCNSTPRGHPPPPPPARQPPPEPQYLQISPGQRLALRVLPRPPPPAARLPSPPGRPSPTPAEPPAPRRAYRRFSARPGGRPGVSAPSPRLLFFVAGVSGEGSGRVEKLGDGAVEAREGPGVELQRVLRPLALAEPSRPPPPPGSRARGLGGACSVAAPRARGSRTFQHRRLRRAPGPRRRRRPPDTPPPPLARARRTRPLAARARGRLVRPAPGRVGVPCSQLPLKMRLYFTLLHSRFKIFCKIKTLKCD
nr:serine/arginine repetitive matrix protein 1-like [Dasypus novemcinctus]